MSQIKKLVSEILKAHPLLIKLIYVGSVVPRADREAELEKDIKDMNQGLVLGVQQLKRHNHVGNHVMFVPVHQIFLERFPAL